MFGRRGLSARLRLICSAACLQATGDGEKLRKVLSLAICDNKSLSLHYEILLQGYLFSGYPKAIESFFALNDVLTAKGLSLDKRETARLEPADELMAKGLAMAEKVHRDKLRKIHNKINAISPDLGYLMIVEGYGNIISRQGADLKTRELAVVSSLTASGSIRQLNSHIRGARNVGCDINEILEAILTCLLWTKPAVVQMAADAWALIATRPKVDISAEYSNYCV